MIPNLLRGMVGILRTGRIEPVLQLDGRPEGIHILAITSLEQDRQALLQIASKSQWKLTLAHTCAEGLEILRRNRQMPIILCDRDLPGLHWKEVMDRLLSNAPDSCAILTSPVNDEYLWKKVIRRGGYDVLTTPFREEAVNRSIHSAWSYRKMRWTRPFSRTVER